MALVSKNHIHILKILFYSQSFSIVLPTTFLILKVISIANYFNVLERKLKLQTGYLSMQSFSCSTGLYESERETVILDLVLN